MQSGAGADSLDSRIKSCNAKGFIEFVKQVLASFQTMPLAKVNERGNLVRRYAAKAAGESEKAHHAKKQDKPTEEWVEGEMQPACCLVQTSAQKNACDPKTSSGW